MQQIKNYVTSVNTAISAHLDSVKLWSTFPEIDELLTPIREICSGGKRTRAKLAMIGGELVGFIPDENTVQLGAALELFQVFALVHDDIIDRAETRRGKPALHISYSKTMNKHVALGAGILAGDLLMSLADRAFAQANPTPQLMAQWSDMCTEVAIGQYLDTYLQDHPGHDIERSFAVIRSKSSRYSVVQPLALGMLQRQADPQLVQSVMEAVTPWGDAFQLRDDELGVFGDVILTGKPSGCDIIEGKKTVLMALLAKRLGDTAELKQISTTLLPEDIDKIRSLIHSTGAFAEHESIINDLYTRGVDHVKALNLPDEAKEKLLRLGESLVRRRA